MSKTDVTDMFQEAWMFKIENAVVSEGIDLWHIKTSTVFSEHLKRKLKYACDNYLDCTVQTKDFDYNGKLIYLNSDYLFYLCKKESK